MGLPKIQTPTFSITQPSTQKDIIIRPFLVKEEKILLIAKESKEDKDVYGAVKQVCQNCVLTEGFDINTVPIYDLEYIFIKLRALSVNNIVKFVVEDSDDGLEYNLEANLDEVEVIMPENFTNKIMITDDVGVMLKAPTAKLADKLKTVDNISDVIYETIKECIDMVFDEEETYEWAGESNTDKEIFLDSLPIEAYDRLGTYFENSPKIEYVVNYENSLGKQKRVVFRNITDFFTLD